MDERVDELFTLAPEDFVSARDNLAAELRTKGDRGGAAEVKALRRPTVGAWAVNQVARANPKEITELLAAGEDLRTAQRAAMAGSGGPSVHAAASRRRAAVDQLARRASDLLEGAGRGRGPHPEIADTFLAASVEPEVAEAVSAGRLDRERRPSADVAELLGLSSDEGPPPKVETRPKRGPSPTARSPAALQEAERDARRARREADRVTKRAQTARRAAQTAKEQAASKERDAREAETEARAAEEAASVAERKVERLRRRRA